MNNIFRSLCFFLVFFFIVFSLRLNDLPHLLSVIAEKNLCLYCTRMAGLAEAWVHVATSFWVEMLIKIHYSKTVTDKLAYWCIPQIHPQKCYKLQAGRITASVMKEAYRTNFDYTIFIFY